MLCPRFEALERRFHVVIRIKGLRPTSTETHSLPSLKSFLRMIEASEDAAWLASATHLLPLHTRKLAEFQTDDLHVEIAAV